MKSFRASPKLVRSVYCLIAVAVLPWVIWNGFIQQLNSEWNDLVLRLRPPTAYSQALGQIVLLAIDDRTASKYGPLPLNRRTLATAMQVLAEAQPRVLAVDLLLPEPGDAAADEALALSLRRYPRLILGAALDSDGQPQASWIDPLPAFASQATVAHVHAAPDPDGDVRSVLLTKEGANTRRWALGLEAARFFLALAGHWSNPIPLRWDRFVCRRRSPITDFSSSTTQGRRGPSNASALRISSNAVRIRLLSRTNS